MGIQINGQTDTISAFDNNFSLAGNVSIGGTLTYEDVTSVDAVGLSTFQAGIQLDDSITHLGDTNTAIRFPADDTVTVETAGSERVRIDSAGNVGVGTDNPTATLEVATSVDGEATLATFKNTSGGGTNETVDIKLGLENISASNIILRAGKEGNHSSGAATDNFFAIHTTENNTSAEKLRITSGGLVGIGTDNPLFHLHVSSDSNTALGVYSTQTTGDQFQVATLKLRTYETSSNTVAAGDFLLTGKNTITFGGANRFIMRGDTGVSLGFYTNNKP